jgi:hypothetical protein
MVAITNYFINAEKAVDVGCQGAQRYQFRPFDAAQFVFPWLPNIDEHEFFAAIHAFLHFYWRYLYFVQAEYPFN